MATEKRLIDANAMREDWLENGENEYVYDTNAVLASIDEQPTVEAVEVVHGYWDDSGRYQFLGGKKAIRCSICGCALSEGEYRHFNWNYCPVCGAKMDGEKDNNLLFADMEEIIDATD